MSKNNRGFGHLVRAIPQTHPLGCAVACVAAVGNVSYDDAHRNFENPSLAWTRGYYCIEVVKALRQLGLDYVFEIYEKHLHDALLDRPGTIVFISPCDAYPSGHYLVRSEDGWMNPWSNFPRMTPAQASFEQGLSGKIGYILFPNMSHDTCFE